MSWQSTISSMPEKLCYLYETGDMSDVNVVVIGRRDQKTMKLHKMILSMASDVFYSQFYSPGKNKARNVILKLERDTDIKAFEILMKFIYTGYFDVDGEEDVTKCYYVAKKYNVTNLVEICEHRLSLTSTPQNVCSLYEKALSFKAERLMAYCGEIISKSTIEVLQSEDFLQCSRNTVLNIIKHDSLNLNSELDLFLALVKWAKNKCKASPADQIPSLDVRKILEPLLPHVRFLNMSQEDILFDVAATSVLTTQEIASITINIAEYGRRPLPSWCIKHERRARPYKEHMLYHDCCAIKDELVNVSFIDDVFRVNKKQFLLVGIAFYTTSCISGTVNLIKKKPREREIFPTRVEYDDHLKMMRVYLVQPVILRGGSSYYVRLQFEHEVPVCGGELDESSDSEFDFYDPNPEMDIECANRADSIGTPHFSRIIYSEVPEYLPAYFKRYF